QGDKIKLWGFAGEEINTMIFLQSHRELLEQFILHFNHQCRDLITMERTKKNAARWLTPVDMGPDEKEGKTSGLLTEQNLFQSPPVPLFYKGRQFTLTARQWEILKLFSRGMGMKELANSLSISPRTVEKILEVIKDKSGLQTRSQLTDLVNKTSF